MNTTAINVNSSSSQHLDPLANVYSDNKIFRIISSYIALTKPRVIELLIISTIPAMLLADRGNVHITKMLLTLLGGWLGAGCANTLNMVLDADIDHKMNRTRNRPLAKDIVTKKHAFIFGIWLGILSMLILGIFVNLISAVLVVITIAFYIIVYTMILKRRTWQNVIWGGAAGCMPALVGWSAQTGTLSWQPWILFAIVFLWTPTHTWALAMHYHDDYAAADVPMLPVLKPWNIVARHMIAYTIITVITSLLLLPATGWIYAAVAIISGLWFIGAIIKFAYNLNKNASIKPLRIFLLSNTYLATLCLALSIDSLFNIPILS